MSQEEEIVIDIRHLSKVYKIFDRPSDRVKEALSPSHKRYSREFYALQDINLSIRRGETVGIIGKNGAGKSTLLKVITGVLAPSGGELHVHGSIASLLELGAGFNPEMSGVENIYMNGTIMGRWRAGMDELYPAIAEFADIGEFIHQPVKMYSSGMFARLAFAANVFIEPKILIVDEALSVGDSKFQIKCMRKMKQLMEGGTAVLFVSHDMNGHLARAWPARGAGRYELGGRPLHRPHQGEKQRRGRAGGKERAARRGEERGRGDHVVPRAGPGRS